MALRAKVWRYAVLLHLLLAVSSGLAADLCQLCDCEWHANGLDMDRIICQTRSRELFEEDLEWPKVARIGVIEFKDMTSSVLPVFKCDKPVEEIRFEGSNLRGLDKKSLSYLKNVKKLSFANNSIEKLAPEVFRNTKGLRALNLRSNKLEEIPVGLFAELDKLSTVDLSFNRLQILSDKLIDTVKRVPTVILRKNSLYAVDQVEVSGNAIKSLDLSQNNLRFLKSKQFKSFGQLQHLNLSHNGIREIQDDAFVELDALLTLDLSNNQLFSIELILPSDLRTFTARNNILAGWPIKEINPALHTVDLHNNTLEVILIRGPETIYIEQLIVSENQLDNFPHRNFSLLRSLDLSFNRFEAIPEFLGSTMPNLVRLEMSGNPIEDLLFRSPITVSQLVFQNMPKLKVIRENSFENVTARPSSAEAEPLLDLDISHCPLLTTIEDGAFRGVAFHDFILSRNNISHIPSSLTNWSTIEGVLDLQANPIDCSCASDWIMTEIVNKLYENSETQYLLEELRCGAPEERKGVRLVRFYRHVAPFCGATGRAAQMRMLGGEAGEEQGPAKAGFDINAFVSNRRGPSPWLIVGVCAFVLIAMIVVGLVIRSDAKRRYENSRRRMLFSEL